MELLKAMVATKHGDVEVSGGGHVRFRESGDGSPVLLIHGTGGPAWFGSIERLASRHRVVDYDRRGFGSSSALQVRGYLDDQIADSIAVIESLGLRDSVVVGHSWGGIVALGLAIRAPELVSRLILMEPPLDRAREKCAELLAESAHPIGLSGVGGTNLRASG